MCRQVRRRVHERLVDETARAVRGHAVVDCDGGTMMWLLAQLIPTVRTRGWWERREVRRHAGRSGILFSFRGPPAFQSGRYAVAVWSGFRIVLDGAEEGELGGRGYFDAAGRPFWRAVRPGAYAVELRGFPDVLLWSGEVVVGPGPVVVAVWPETAGNSRRPARVLVDGVEVP